MLGYPMTVVRREALGPTVSGLFDRLFEQAFAAPFFSWAHDDRAGAERLAGVDLAEDQQAYFVTVALPGVNPQDVEVTVEGDVLRIKGEMKTEAQSSQRPLVREIGQVSYHRALRLPGEVDVERAQAVYEHGLLKLTLPKAEHLRPKTIAITAS